MEEKKIDTRNNGNATAATRAKNKYRDKTYDRMELALPKGLKAEIVEQVRQGKAKSNNDYVVAAVKEKMERENL
jgi:lysophospholipid acyltransferase (LPLAT)-like uncharacterized protein